MANALSNHIRSRFPAGDWFGAGDWTNEELARREPKLVTVAMQRLAELATPTWFLSQMDTENLSHPLVQALCGGGYLMFWPVFRVGNDLAALDGQIPEDLRNRLLNAAEFEGAMAELGAAARLRRSGVRFVWYPPEGGEFGVEDGAIRYVEVKRPRRQSDRAEHELGLLFEIGLQLHEAANGLSVSFALKRDLADHMPRGWRQGLSAQQLVDPFVAAIS